MSSPAGSSAAGSVALPFARRVLGCLWLAWLLAPAGIAQVEGTVRWAFVVGSSAESSASLGADGTIYVGAQIRTTPPAGKLWAIDRNGTRRWEFTAPDWIDSTPVVAEDGTVYVGCWDGKLYAFSSDGRKRWEYNTGAFVFTAPALGPDGTIYLGGGDSVLRAITPDGRTKWTFAAGDWVNTPTVAGDGTIYFGCWDRQFYALNPDGTERWRFRTGAEVTSSAALATDGTIYLTSGDGLLYALQPDGRLRWSFRTGGALLASPVTGADGTVYVGSTDRYFYAVNPDGTQKWRVSAGKGVQSSAAVRSDGTIIFGSDDGNIRALNPDGTTRWIRSTGDVVISSPLVARDGSVYVGSYDGRLYAIDGSGAGPSVLSSWPAHGGDPRRSSLAPPARTGRLRNLAVRADAGQGGNLILGWSLAGRQSKRFLVRGVGPGLLPFGVTGAMPNPRLLLHAAGGPLLQQNDDWDSVDEPALLETAAATVGAFPLSRGVPDAALLAELVPGNYTATIEPAAGSAGGNALAEAYDLAPSEAGARFLNLSTLGQVAGGDGTLIPGLVVGPGKSRLLVRAVGPGLAPFGVPTPLAQPTITVRSGETVVARGGAWAAGTNRADLEAAARLTGAFPLEPGSADCALILTLDAGAYSLLVGSQGGGAGSVLVEVYSLD